jgi:hypothetical protein
MTRNRLLAVCLTSLSLLASCGNEDGIPFEDLEERAFVAGCNLQIACGAIPDAATCRTSLQTEIGFYATMAQDIASGRVIYDSAKARDCLQQLNDVTTCSQTELAAFLARAESACEGTFTGTAAPGTPCFLSEECANRGVCETPAGGCATNTCCQGTCVARPAPIPIGGDCSGLEAYQTCVANAACVFDSVTGTSTCRVPTAGDGDVCTGGGACIPPAGCVTDATTPGTGRCVAPAGRGQTCDPNRGAPCDDPRDWCDPASNTCAPKSVVGGACTTGGACIEYATCDGTTCVGPSGLAGATCDPTGLNPCFGHLECDAATSSCALPPRVDVGCW